MDECDNMWICNRSSVEDAEEGTILGCWVLTWWGEDFLETGRGCLNLAAMVRVMKMHVGPGLW